MGFCCPRNFEILCNQKDPCTNFIHHQQTSQHCPLPTIPIVPFSSTFSFSASPSLQQIYSHVWKHCLTKRRQGKSTWTPAGLNTDYSLQHHTLLPIIFGQSLDEQQLQTSEIYPQPTNLTPSASNNRTTQTPPNLTLANFPQHFLVPDRPGPSLTTITPPRYVSLLAAENERLRIENVRCDNRQILGREQTESGGVVRIVYSRRAANFQGANNRVFADYFDLVRWMITKASCSPRKP